MILRVAAGPRCVLHVPAIVAGYGEGQGGVRAFEVLDLEVAGPPRRTTSATAQQQPVIIEVHVEYLRIGSEAVHDTVEHTRIDTNQSIRTWNGSPVGPVSVAAAVVRRRGPVAAVSASDSSRPVLQLVARVDVWFTESALIFTVSCNS